MCVHSSPPPHTPSCRNFLSWIYPLGRHYMGLVTSYFSLIFPRGKLQNLTVLIKYWECLGSSSKNIHKAPPGASVTFPKAHFCHYMLTSNGFSFRGVLKSCFHLKEHSLLCLLFFTSHTDAHTHMHMHRAVRINEIIIGILYEAWRQKEKHGKHCQCSLWIRIQCNF